MILWMCVLLLVIAGAVVYLRRRDVTPAVTRTAAPTAKPGLGGSGRYHAVSIRVGPTACSAADHLRGRRFLSEAAPLLPLNECDAHKCSCRFVHHADRRDGDDRRSPFQSGFGGSAARVSEDRRDKEERRTTSH